MSALIKLLNDAKANGNSHIWADCDSVANNGLEWLLRNGYTAKNRDEAYSLILNERFGIAPTTTWIWSIDEELEIANA